MSDNVHRTLETASSNPWGSTEPRLRTTAIKQKKPLQALIN